MSRSSGSETKLSDYIVPYKRPVLASETRSAKDVWDNILENPNVSTDEYYKWAELNPVMAESIAWFAPLADIQRMDDWERFLLVPIESPHTFWIYMAELRREYKIQKRVFGRRSGFWNDRQHLLSAYENGDLFTLQLILKKPPKNGTKGTDRVFVKGSSPFLYLPVLLSVSSRDDQRADILWVARRARRMGFGSEILKLAKIERVGHVLQTPIAQAFWKTKPNITIAK